MADRAEDKENSGNVLNDEKGTIVLSLQVGGRHPYTCHCGC